MRSTAPPLPRNRNLEVTQITEALETGEERSAEVVEAVGLVRVHMRCEINSILESRNCVFEVTNLLEVLETEKKEVAEFVKTSRFAMVTMRNGINDTPDRGKRILDVTVFESI